MLVGYFNRSGPEIGFFKETGLEVFLNYTAELKTLDCSLGPNERVEWYLGLLAKVNIVTMHVIVT